MISGIIKVKERLLKAELKAEADNTYRDLDDFRISQKPNLINY